MSTLREAIEAYAAEKRWEYTNYGPEISPDVIADDLRAILVAHPADQVRIDTANEIIWEIERCALQLASENDEAGNYLVAAVLKKAADIARTTAGIS